MIVWVVSDRDVASSIAGKPRGYWEKFTSNVASNIKSKIDSATNP